jgi:hypothetical protein
MSLSLVAYISGQEKGKEKSLLPGYAVAGGCLIHPDQSRSGGWTKSVQRGSLRQVALSAQISFGLDDQQDSDYDELDDHHGSYLLSGGSCHFPPRGAD